jgi:hypothetical protein
MPDSLYDECAMQLREFLSSGLQYCPRPDFCLNHKRHREIEAQLLEQDPWRSTVIESALAPLT